MCDAPAAAKEWAVAAPMPVPPPVMRMDLLDIAVMMAVLDVGEIWG